MVTDQINALKSALAPTALIAAKTVNYSGGISGSGTFSVYANHPYRVPTHSTYDAKLFQRMGLPLR